MSWDSRYNTRGIFSSLFGNFVRTEGRFFTREYNRNELVDGQSVRYTIFFSRKKMSFLVLSRGSPENTRAREYVSLAHISWKLPRECEDLRALTDAEHALTSVTAFCHFYGPRVPKIWPLSTAKRNTLVSKTRKHDTTEKARSEGLRSHIIRLSYNPSSARSSVHECVS